MWDLHVVDLCILISLPRDRRDRIFPTTFDLLALVFAECLRLLWNFAIARDLGRIWFG